MTQTLKTMIANVMHAIEDNDIRIMLQVAIEDLQRVEGLANKWSCGGDATYVVVPREYLAKVESYAQAIVDLENDLNDILVASAQAKHEAVDKTIGFAMKEEDSK